MRSLYSTRPPTLPSTRTESVVSSRSSAASRSSESEAAAYAPPLPDDDKAMPLAPGRARRRGEKVSMSSNLQELIRDRLDTLRGKKRARSASSATTSSAASSTRRAPLTKKNKLKHVIVDLPVGKRKNSFPSTAARKKTRYYSNDDDDAEEEL